MQEPAFYRHAIMKPFVHSSKTPLSSKRLWFCLVCAVLNAGQPGWTADRLQADKIAVIPDKGPDRPHGRNVSFSKMDRGRTSKRATRCLGNR